MIPRSGVGVLNKASTAAKGLIGRRAGHRRSASQGKPSGSSQEKPAQRSVESNFVPKCPYTFVADAEKQKRSKDREFFISILESSPTRRDAKTYLQTFGSQASLGKLPAADLGHDGIASVAQTPRFVQGQERVQASPVIELPHVAIVKFTDPQLWHDDVLAGVAKTLTQLRTLGLLSIVVVDCNGDRQAAPSWRTVLKQQATRIALAISQHGVPGAKLIDSALSWKARHSTSLSEAVYGGLAVRFGDALTTPLRDGYMVIVPSCAHSEEGSEIALSDSNEVVETLVRFLSGLQMPAEDVAGDEMKPLLSRLAMVDRVIVADPLGGIPAKHRPNGAHIFINMEDEYEGTRVELGAMSSLGPSDSSTSARTRHLENLKLARDCLAILPSTSSTIITSPAEAANLIPATPEDQEQGVAGFVAVGTRKSQNPLIHNLLTDRPVHSPSLPQGRIKPSSRSADQHRTPRMPTTTLAKKGLPVTIFPHLGQGPWRPPAPGSPRLRLTDTCVDLSRLVHLINDSFGRKLDAAHYLERVKDSLAGVIIAGEYEGGAILTWERPFGMDEETAYRTGRLVPYLDKFAVLKKSQGAGGVADIVFNAMVRDCFPEGVCWRSRKNNPVNKWYFERSRGTRKLDDSNWAMFWTTPDAPLDDQRMRDYEDVCRNVVPSWADKQKQAD